MPAARIVIRNGYERLIADVEWVASMVVIKSWNAVTLWDLMRLGSPDHRCEDFRKCYLTMVSLEFFERSFEYLMLRRIQEFSDFCKNADEFDRYLQSPDLPVTPPPVSEGYLESLGWLEAAAGGYSRHPLWAGNEYLQEVYDAVNMHIGRGRGLNVALYSKLNRIRLLMPRRREVD